MTTLPEVDQLLTLEPNAATKVDSINISSHKDLWEIAGEEGEEVVMCVCLCMGIVKVTKPGSYRFDMTSDDGVGLAVDDIRLLNQVLQTINDLT